MRNWKTTLAGIVAILTVASKFVNNEPMTAQDWGTLSVGLGLLGAKDFNVTHSNQ